jgi:hypothetical protein
MQIDWIYSPELTSEQIVGLCDAIMEHVFPQDQFPTEYAEIDAIRSQHVGQTP